MISSRIDSGENPGFKFKLPVRKLTDSVIADRYSYRYRYRGSNELLVTSAVRMGQCSNHRRLSTFLQQVLTVACSFKSYTGRLYCTAPVSYENGSVNLT
jgi:hypothetical protein